LTVVLSIGSSSGGISKGTLQPKEQKNEPWREAALAQYTYVYPAKPAKSPKQAMVATSSVSVESPEASDIHQPTKKNTEGKIPLLVGVEKYSSHLAQNGGLNLLHTRKSSLLQTMSHLGLDSQR